MSEWIGPEGLVYSYEPIPETISYLHNKVKKCGVDNVIVHNAAVSTQAGEFKMRIPSHTLYRATRSSEGDIPVKTFGCSR
jgi:FkbM family methyltransferase